MKKRIIVATVAGVLITAMGILILTTFSGGGSSGQALAASQPPRDNFQTVGSLPSSEQVRPSLVAVAIGQLHEADGDNSTIDFRAAIRNEEVGGALRFYCEEMGYYNGGVRTLSVENGAIKATGGGGLFKPDGTRVQVRYTAEFSIDSEEATIVVQGKEYEYTMEGTLDPGFVQAVRP